jgi:hypothetical protein
MTGYNMEEIFNEIHEAITNRDRKPGEFSAAEYAAHHGKSPAWGRLELEKAVALGGVERREGNVNGHRCILYRKTES